MFTQVAVCSCLLCARAKLDVETQMCTCSGPEPTVSQASGDRNRIQLVSGDCLEPLGRFGLRKSKEGEVCMSPEQHPGVQGVGVGT